MDEMAINNGVLDAMKNLRSRVAQGYESMSTIELSQAIIAIRFDEFGLDYAAAQGFFDSYGRIDEEGIIPDHRFEEGS